MAPHLNARFVAAAAVVAATVLALVVPASATTAAPATAGKGQADHRPLSLGPIPIRAVGTVANGSGGCPVATSFSDTFEFFAPGDGRLKITQPRTGDVVLTTIGPGGDYQGRSARESYDAGRITGDRSTARYSYTTAGGCTETYDASFVLQLAGPANPLDRIDATATCSRRQAANESRCTLKATNRGQRSLYGVSFALPSTTVSAVSASGGGVCTSESGFGVCKWTAADGSAGFLATQSRTVNVTTTPPVQAGTTTSQICVSGNPQFAENYCVDELVTAPAADLGLELFSNPRTKTRQRRSDPFPRVNYRVVVTNHGPDTSPSAVLRFVSNQPMFAFFSHAPQRKIGRCTARARVWTCNVEALPPRETAVIGMSSIPISTSGKRPGVVTTVGTVTGALPDPVAKNNRDSVRTRVT